MSWADMTPDARLGAIYRLSRKGKNPREIAKSLGAPNSQVVTNVARNNDIGLSRAPRADRQHDDGLPKSTVNIWTLPVDKRRDAIRERAARAAAHQLSRSYPRYPLPVQKNWQ